MVDYKEEILVDEDYLKSLLSEIKKSKHTIDMEVYIFEEDDVGQLVADALCVAAKRGVKIRVLVDGIGSINWGGRITKQMELNGITTKIFHPLPWKISQWHRSVITRRSIFSKLFYLLSKINSRNHRKICIIDQSVVFVGSANISNHLFSNHKASKGWRETTVKLIDVNVDEVQYAFNKAWGKIKFKTRLYKSFKKIAAHPVFRLNYSWRLRRKYYKLLLDRISKAKIRIWVTNAYFVPDNFLLKKLVKARRRGVDVRILLPSKSDVIVESIVSTIFYSILLKHNVLIYEYLPTILHAKILIVDNWYSVGSLNLNYRSFKHDLELNVDIHTHEAREAIDNQFLLDLSKSKQLHLIDVNNESIFKKLLARLILIFRNWI